MRPEDIDIDLALRYMGIKDEAPADLMFQVSDCVRELCECVSPKYMYKLFDIEDTQDGISVVGTDLVLSGDSIRKHLSGCTRCVLLCATLSAAADTLIRRYSAYDMTRSFIIDCISGSAIESVCDQAEKDMRAKLPDKFFTWRFSPGYGDLPLGLQRDFLAVLNAGKRIGLNVTDSMMLVPSKSVTAVIGVSDVPVLQKNRGCQDCNMFETCSFRKGGLHCGS